MPRITAVDLYNYTKCAHRVYLDGNGDPSQKSEVSAFVKLLWDKGLQTEREYIARLGYDAFDDLQALSVEAAALATNELMAGGARIIYQGCLICDQRVGRPDLLLRQDERPSKFGAYSYEPVDIKAGRGYEERDGEKGRFKKHYAFQILFYHELLAEVQGVWPATCRIINSEGEFESFERDDFEVAYRQAWHEVQRLVAGEETSEPVLGSQCHQCEWLGRCRPWVERTRDPSGLFFVGNQKFGLKAVGLRTFDDIARMNVGDYLKPPLKIKGLGEKSLVRMKHRARVRLSGQPEIRPGFSFPEVRTEIYFDIEDDPTRDVTYLFGMWIRESGGKGRFEYILAERPEDEGEACRRFWEFVDAQSDCAFYVYSPKERSSLRRLGRKYGLAQGIFEKYLSLEFDLYQDLVVEYSDWPTYSYGIKQIARLTGFSWRDVDPSGANSIAWYNDYLALTGKEQAQVRKRILEYNEDDCMAMAHIKDWFVAGHPAAGHE